ncbi:hypothetical protein V3C99_016954 [Haemonchus contortus]|uniref:ABC transporter ATP-binding protein n=2 Tax=Haemonchus contortus TaxID=6289 RepID=A0A7I4YZH7_HAECO|nr:unnamed protein product [Haemonchus contortus]
MTAIKEEEGSISRTFFEKLLDVLLCRGDLSTEKLERKPVSVAELFRYASRRDCHYVAAGFVLAVVVGAIMPLTCIFGGLYVNIYLMNTDHVGNESLWRQAMYLCAGYFGVGIALFILCYLQNYFLSLASHNIVGRIRKEFVKAVLAQNAAWFDENNAGTITTKLNENVAQIEDGIGDKIGMLARGVTVFIASAAFAFYYDWRITLVCIWDGPVSAITMAIMSRLSSPPMQGMMSVSGEAGAIAEEAIMNVKTVAACNGQKHMVKKYDEQLRRGVSFAIRYSFINGFCEGFMFFQLYIFYAAAFLYGIPSYYNGITAEPGTIFIVASTVLLGSYFFGLLGPHMMAIMKARIAAAIIYETIDQAQDIVSKEGKELRACKGRLEFRDVHFKYPTRETPILQGLSWVAEPGETIAFVGKSGCGKSTSIGLLTRLYDCDKGSALLDGQEIRSIKTSDLRKMIGIVQQEPCLFNGTIRENIVLGRSITDEQAEDAARIANAHDFIMKLDKGYDTIIGSGGVSLSGGQKQRIAIARAVATQPKILLLDEATSALDSESENVVQLALNRASRGRTTIVIAHRLSTLKDVQRIYAIQDGKVVEAGTHFELLEKGGLYSALAAAQEVGVNIADISTRTRKYSDSIDSHAYSAALVRHDLRGSGMTRRSVSSIVSQPTTTRPTDKPTQIKAGRGGGIFRVYLTSLRSSAVFWACLIGSVLRGMELPLCAYFVGFSYQALEQTAETFIPFMWLAIGLFIFLALYSWLFLTVAVGFGGWSGEAATANMRVKVLKSLLSQEAEYFDRPQCSNAACVAELSTKAPDVQACLDYRFMLMVNNMCAVVVCIPLSIIACWESGVAMTVLLALFIVSMWITSNRISASMEKKSEIDKTPELSIEVFEHAKTIQLLAVQDYFLQKYESYEAVVKKQEKWTTIYQSIQFGLTQSYIYFSDLVTYGIGASMIYFGRVDSKDTVVSATSANFAGWAVIFASAALGDFVRSHFAAQSLYALIDSYKKAEGGATPELDGSIKVEKVTFSYPSRPDVKVAQNLNLMARCGQAIALVGASGCGKSTVIQLLERFYEPDSGNIKIDNHELKQLCRVHLRNNIALVGQEPILFKGSIIENITLGLEDVSVAEVQEACRQANAANFVEAFPQGYETDVGEKGGSLSGGQKQRIAIARALIRKPKVILLDEATSALDTESEKVVQNALNEASHGRTSITIAHRLSTVRDADRIYYIENGAVVEYGTHEELIEADGKYALLVKAQQLAKTD